MLYRSVVIILLCISSRADAQTTQAKIDSLSSVLKAAKEDTSKVLLLCELSGYYFQNAPAKGIACGDQALKLSEKLNYKNGLIQANLAIGRCYAIQSSMPQALKYFQDGLVVAQNLKKRSDEGRLLSCIGNVYKVTREYDKSLEYFTRSKEVYAATGEKNLQRLMNNIGGLYFEQSKYAQSLPYYFEGVRMEKADKADPAELTTLYNNIGGAYSGLKKNDSALYYLQQALYYNEQTGNLRSKMHSLMAVSFIYMDISTKKYNGLPDSLNNKEANLAKAMEYAQSSLTLCRQLGILDQQLRICYDIMNILSAQGKYQQALNYFKEYDSLNIELQQSTSDKKIAMVEAEFKVKLTTDSLKYQNLLKDHELKRRNTQRNYLIILVLFIGTVSTLLINRQKLKHAQKIKMAEAERLRVEQVASQKLEDFANSIQEKNQLIETITAEIEKHKEQTGQQAQADYSLLNQLQQSILLTDEQWESFKETFDKVHIGYRHRLRDKMTDLSPAETRFVLLSKLKLTNKEMAGMLGVGAQAMRANKYRLMKKLGIDDDTLLDELIQNT